ncbi:MAG TPA: HAMP domain-containing sensor histidine kinase [Actinomycetota bacterium]|nr:HAMP domain-containing sensor histidine kinase [Actinomycetota bacterium]
MPDRHDWREWHEREHARSRQPARGFRPPWWPEHEPFPPPPGRRPFGPEHFGRRVGLLMLAAFLVLLVGGGVLSALFGGWDARPGGGPDGGWHVFPFVPLWLLFLGGVFIVIARAVRRTTRPVDDVMRAADRVAAGDYSVRVRSDGPPGMRRLGTAFNAMTERLAANEELRRNLLADVAHDLKTPLSVIRGNVEGVLDGVYPPDEAHLRTVVEETAVMLRLLDDLQTLSTAEAGMLQLHREAVAPGRLVDDVVAAFRARAAEKGIELSGQATAGLPAIEADPVRIGEVLANLVANAIRHTPKGGSVRVDANHAGDGVTFVVADTGPGIPLEQLPQVFDRFVKSSDSGGAGLGLAIAKRLVEAHRGRIEARSPETGGAEVRFTLPLA